MYTVSMAELIRLTLTAQEGLLLGSFIDGFMEQFEGSSIEDRQDPDILVAYEMCVKMRPYLPKLKESK